MRKLKLALLASIFTTPAFAAPELVPYTSLSSGWQVHYHTSSGNCGMVRKHALGTEVIVNYEHMDNTWVFSLANPKWDKVRNGEKYYIILTFEDGSKWNGNFQGQVFNGLPIISLLNTKLDFIKQFMAHDKMTISTKIDGDITTVNLDGSWDGMIQVAACQKAHQS
jgi:hypothetical protein